MYILLLYAGDEAISVGPAVRDAAGSMTVTEVTMSTTHLHTKTTTIGAAQPYKQLTVGGALPGEGMAMGQWRGVDMEQGACGTSAVHGGQLQQPFLHFRM